MSFEQKSCLFCLKEIADGIDIFGPIGKTLNVWEVIVKYFWFDLLKDVDSAAKFVCSDCWLKVKSFHEFYLMVEALHNKCASEIGEEPTLESCDVEEAEILEEHMIEREVHTTDEVVELEIDVLDYGTEDDFYLDEQIEESCNGGKKSYQEIEFTQCQSVEMGVELDTEIEPRFETTHIPVSAQKRVQTIEIHNILPLQAKKIPNKSITRPKKTKSNGSKQRIDGIVFCCYMCSASFPTTQAVQKHFLLHDQAESHKLVSKTCDKAFASENLLRNHIDNVDERQRRSKKNFHDTICPICEDVMKFGDLKAHLERVHNNIPQKKEKFVCKVCNKICLSSDAFTKHAWTHMNEDLTRAQCDICEKWLKNKNILQIHKKNHEKIPMKCPHCGKVKSSVLSLRAHITSSHSARKYQCTLCDKSFSRPIALREHMAVHTGESLYNCDYCPKSFKSNANMYKHMRELHTERWNIDRAMKRQKKL